MPDIDITVTIPEALVEEARVHILLAEPKEDFDGTDLEWIRWLIKNYLIGLYRKGKTKAATIDYKDIIGDN